MYRWKGKLVTKKVYDKRIQMQKNAKLIWKRRQNFEDLKKTEETEQPAKSEVIIQQAIKHTLSEDVPEYEEGQEISADRRIVELETLGSEMWCCSCKEALSFQFIENEVRRGFGSILTVRCHKCLILNSVRTGKQQSTDATRTNVKDRFEINTEAVKGVVDSKIGYSQLAKLFAFMKIPCITATTFKRHEKQIERATENEELQRIPSR